MSYPLATNGSYGSGAAGAVTDPSTVLNAYANVTAYVAGGTITIGTPSTSIYSSFAVGQEILLHVSAQTTGTDGTYLGHYQTAHITGVSGSVLTIDNPIVEGVLMAAASFANYVIQAVAIPSFTMLTLTAATVSPTAYSTTNKYGGIVALKCTNSLALNGGKISLGGLGIPTANKAYRIIDAQEASGSGNTDQYSGWENHITSRRMYLNSGDGTAFIQVANLNVINTASRIGYAAGTGVQFTRSASNCAAGAAGLGSGTGGSVILLAAGTITNFNPAIISTQPSAAGGQGLGRCYIASETKLLNDEGLYAKDVIGGISRLPAIGITSYGNGNYGAVTNPTQPLNNYAVVTGIDSTGKVLIISGATTNGIAQFTPGTFVLFQAAAMKASDSSYLGTIFRSLILAWDGTSQLTLRDPVTNVFPAASLSNYACQVITVPDFTNLTITTDYNYTPAYSAGKGGVCALTCNGTLSLTSGGLIDMTGKGNNSVVPPTSAVNLSNSGMANCLPVGQGNGSVFIVANVASLDSTSRIGATYDGSALGGISGGYVGTSGISGNSGTPGGYIGNSTTGTGAGSGSGAAGGSCGVTNGAVGGYAGGNGTAGAYLGGYGGSYIFAIIGTLSFIQAAFSTGGAPGTNGTGVSVPFVNPTAGGSGYGGAAGNFYENGNGSSYGAGGGAYNGGGGGYVFGERGGGSSGNCFIYANTVTSSNNYAGALLGGTT